MTKKRMPPKRSKSPAKPRTAKNVSGRIPQRHKTPSRASDSMSLTELQNMAKSKGIPFGGITRHHLINKINNYII